MNPFPTLETNQERIESIKRMIVAMLMATEYMKNHPQDCTVDGLMEVLRSFTTSEVEAQAAGMLLASEVKRTAKP